MKDKTILSAIANALVARANSLKANRPENVSHWEDTLNKLADFLPSGSGFDAGTAIDWERSNGKSKIVLRTQFHHMNDGGFYDGWTEHTIAVLPDLLHGFTLTISGRNRNGIRDYIHEVFSEVLTDWNPLEYLDRIDKFPEFSVSSTWDPAGVTQTFHCAGQGFKWLREAQEWAARQMLAKQIGVAPVKDSPNP